MNGGGIPSLSSVAALSEPDPGPWLEPEGTSILDRLRARVLFGDDIENQPPVEPLIDGVLDLDTLAVLFGRPGAGKTHVALDISLHVATNSWWYDHETHGGNVLYVVAEGVRGIGPRVRAWRELNRYHGQLEGIRWLPVAANLLRPEEAYALSSIAAERPTRLVVIDTLARSMAGGDENAYRDMSLVIDSAERVRAATGACVLLVHHTGKDQGQGARGHSSLLGAVHTELEVKNAGDGILTLATTKQKDHADNLMPWRFVLSPAADSVAVARYTGTRTADSTLSSKAQAVREALLSVDIDGGVSSSVWEEISVQNGVSRSGFFQHRKTLLDNGEVQNIGTDQRPRYTATGSGIEAVGPKVQSESKAGPVDGREKVQSSPTPLEGLD